MTTYQISWQLFSLWRARTDGDPHGLTPLEILERRVMTMASWPSATYSAPTNEQFAAMLLATDVQANPPAPYFELSVVDISNGRDKMFMWDVVSDYIEEMAQAANVPLSAVQDFGTYLRYRCVMGEIYDFKDSHPQKFEKMMNEIQKNMGNNSITRKGAPEGSTNYTEVVEKVFKRLFPGIVSLDDYVISDDDQDNQDQEEEFFDDDDAYRSKKPPRLRRNMKAKRQQAPSRSTKPVQPSVQALMKKRDLVSFVKNNVLEKIKSINGSNIERTYARQLLKDVYEAL